MKIKAQQIVNNLLDDLDPDDPETVLQSHPGFEFRTTLYQGDMVFIKGPGEDTSDWPRHIGSVLQGPRDRWYVIGMRGVPPEELGEFGFGVHQTPELRTFDSREDAAMAIWLVWSRLPYEQRKGYLL